MFLLKTDKARDELRPGQRSLSQRERALLLMADGRHSMTDFSPLFGGAEEAGRVAKALQAQGYLQWSAPAAAAPAAVPPIRTRPSVPAAAPSVPQPAEPAEPAPPANAADTFDGKRSLATTRMFLFDLCERMFARRDPAQAERLREALREARDGLAMLAVADTMLTDIEREAGAERAASIRERIDKLLPTVAVH
ncbi:MAG: hypothetical protein EOO24_28825 [Comamonadaceae bacterium]|nr:MAG: hypothetical protein EOO24_28825 [Comamonadaceae bacterium]